MRSPIFDPDLGFIAMAHRGGSLLPQNVGKENTVAAFSRAVELGYRWLETDVHATADGHLVAFHDPHLERVSDARGPIGELTLEQVRRVRVGGEQIPTMQELFEQFEGANFNIDLKADGTPALLAALIDEQNAQQRVCVGSFSQSRLDEFRRITDAAVTTSCGPVETALTAALPPLVRFTKGAALQVPTTHPVLGLTVPIVTPRVIKACHAAGVSVQVWTINDPVQMNALIDLGVDGLVTDAIDVLKDVLVERGLWREPSH